MDIAIVAPCPVPYVIGGAENLWRGLQDHVNEETPHQAEIIKLPSREHSFRDLMRSYRDFARLDLTGFDVVVSGKYPAWMVGHPRHVCWMLHRLRGLYDTYHFLGMPDRYPGSPRPVEELRAFMAAHAGRRDALEEFFERVEALDRAGVPDDVFAFPGPFVRELVHWLDDVGLGAAAVRRHGAIARTVAGRDGYFPAGADVFVAHPPTGLPVRPGRGRGSYVFTASRLDDPKRVGLLVEAMQHAGPEVELRIAGTGPAEPRLRELAGADPRIRFCGRVGRDELVELYRGARLVAFVPYLEDFGYIALEGMLAGRPVLTVTDAGGPTELVEDGVTGWVVDPTPEAVGAAIDGAWGDRRALRRMGRAALERARQVTWERVLAEVLA